MLLNPGAPGGVMAVIVESLKTAKLATLAVPTFTEVVPVNFFPTIVMTVPPEARPPAGKTLIGDGTP
jgi:hypothetical protein